MPLRNAHLWIPDLARRSLSRPPVDEVSDIYFSLVDHFEPRWHAAPLNVQRERVQAWVRGYPAVAGRHQDSEGRPPQHTFFFPEEEYLPEHMDALADLCRRGWGDVEVHLHHDGDNAEALRHKLLSFTQILHGRHGLLRRGAGHAISYGFIHGNWALNNAHPSGRWCGVDDETSILVETGCYADFTMPGAPDASQARKVNSIYYALPSRQRRAHDSGVDVSVGGVAPPGLMMIQGPLTLNWRRRKLGLLPRLENAEFAWHNPATADRVRLWVRQHVHVIGAHGHVFVKVHTHGAQDQNVKFVFEDGFSQLWTLLERFAADANIRLHYVTAYEMYRKIKELESAVPSPRVAAQPEETVS